MGQPITIGTGMFDLKQDSYKTLVYGKWTFMYDIWLNKYCEKLTIEMKYIGE